MGFPGDFSGARQDQRQEGTGTTLGKMIRSHHRLGGHEFEHSPELVTDRKAGRTELSK